MTYYIINFISHGNDITNSEYVFYFDSKNVSLIEDRDWDQKYVKYDEVKNLLLKLFDEDDIGVKEFIQDEGNGWCFGERIYHNKNILDKYFYLPIHIH